MVIELTGTATSVVLTNLTADIDEEVFLEFGGDITLDVTLDTGAFTAVRDDVNVVGLVAYSGFERWLPLIPGNNTIRIEPTGGTATARFVHYPFYL
jgi:hypothetical protein